MGQHTSPGKDKGQRRLLHLLGPCRRHAMPHDRRLLGRVLQFESHSARTSGSVDRRRTSPVSRPRRRLGDVVPARQMLPHRHQMQSQAMTEACSFAGSAAPCRTLCRSCSCSCDAALLSPAATLPCSFGSDRSYPQSRPARVAKGWLLLRLIGRPPAAVKRG